MVFDTLQSQIVLGLSIPVVILTQRDTFSLIGLLSQIIVYATIAYNADCLVKGNCQTWSWLSVAFPILYSVMYIMFWDRLVIQPRLPIQTGIIIGSRPIQPVAPVPTTPETTTTTSTTATATPAAAPTTNGANTASDANQWVM